jgi:GAF domain-containing protein
MIPNFLEVVGKMQMESAPLRKKVALLGLPDEALDVLTHYTQGSDWETVVVVSASPDAYAARMAEVLGIPVQDVAHRDQLAACDLVIVGQEAGIDVESIREMLQDEPVLVADLDEVSRELSFHPFADGEFDFGREEASIEMDASPGTEEETVADEAIETDLVTEIGDPIETDRVTEIGVPVETDLAPELEDAPEFDDSTEMEESTDAESAPALDLEEAPLPPARVLPKPSRTRPRLKTGSPDRDRTRFDLTGCLGQDPEGHFCAVPLDGESQEFQILLAEVLASTGAQTGSIMLPDADGEHLAIAAAVGLPRDLVAVTRPRLGEGLVGRAYATGSPIVLQGEVPQFAEAAGLAHRIAASIPIQRDGRRMGVLSINIDSKDAIVESELIQTLDRFIEPAQRAIFRSVDLAELPVAAQREILFRSLDAVMGLDAGFPERLGETGEILRKAVRADFAHVYLIDPLSQRLELISPARGLTSTEGRYLPLDRGFYSWVVDRGVFQLLTVADSETGMERAIACLPVRTSRPYGLLVLEHFTYDPESRNEVRELLVSVIEQLEEIFELEQGMESQDILAGLRMRITDKKNELELLPPALRAQSALEFALQVLAAEAAIWLEGPGARPVIAQPQTRQAARILADVWDTLDPLCGWIREHDAATWGGTGPGWEPGAPEGPSPYVGVRDDRGDGVIVIFFSDQDRLGGGVQLPARILIEVLRSVCGLIPVEADSAENDDLESAA